MKEQITKRFEKLSIQQIEATADREKAHEIESRNRFIEALYYLRHTGRYRENKLYKKTSFEEYIKARFGISGSSFELERRAFICHPEATENIGVGTVKRVLSRVEATKVPEVLREIEHKATTPGSKSLYEITREVIEKHGRKAEPKPEAIAVAEQKVDKSREIIAAQAKEIKDLKSQRDRLTETVRKLKTEIAYYHRALEAGMKKRAV